MTDQGCNLIQQILILRSQSHQCLSVTWAQLQLCDSVCLFPDNSYEIEYMVFSAYFFVCIIMPILSLIWTLF